MVIIAIGGPHGSGKSSVAEKIAKRFDMKFISAGRVFRELAKEKGYSLKEFSKLAKKMPEIDREIDMRTQKLGAIDNTVVDAQLAAHFTPQNDGNADLRILKICITASPEVRWERIANRDKISLEEAKKETDVREEVERERFSTLYGINIDDLSVYDLVINTDNLSKEFVYQLVEVVVDLARRS